MMMNKPKLQLLSDIDKESKTSNKDNFKKKRRKIGSLFLMLELQEFRCFYCGVILTIYNVTKDHFNPRSLGGRIKLGDFVASCSKCNQRKADRLPTKEEKKKLARLFRRLADRIIVE